jgi:hypothetical protein
MSIYISSGYSCARKMSHLLLAGYEDVPSFLNQWKLKKVLYYSLHHAKLKSKAVHAAIALDFGIISGILLVKTLVSERCPIFC